MRRSTSSALLTPPSRVGAALAVPAQAAAPTVELQPDRLARGADIAVPHIEDGVFVDGDRRVELPGTIARVIGPSMGGWMVGTSRPNAVGETLRRHSRVVHVLPSGTVRTVLRHVDPSAIVVSEDGSSLLERAGRRTVQARPSRCGHPSTGRSSPRARSAASPRS